MGPALGRADSIPQATRQLTPLPVSLQYIMVVPSPSECHSSDLSDIFGPLPTSIQVRFGCSGVPRAVQVMHSVHPHSSAHTPSYQWIALCSLLHCRPTQTVSCGSSDQHICHRKPHGKSNDSHAWSPRMSRLLLGTSAMQDDTFAPIAGRLPLVRGHFARAFSVKKLQSASLPRPGWSFIVGPRPLTPLQSETRAD